MKYQVHDRVVHWTYGPGEIVGIEEKTIADETQQYYVLAVDRLTIWVPASEKGESSLRTPVSAQDFSELLNLFKEEAGALPIEQYPRQNELNQRMKHHTLDAVVCLVRDLDCYGRNHKLTRSDQEIMNRARALLLDEWQLSLSQSREHAENQLLHLLHNRPTAA